MYALAKERFSPNLRYHVENNISLDNCVFRIGTDAWCDLICEARAWYDYGYLDDLTEEEHLLLESDAGERAVYGDKSVILDCPMPTWKAPGECVAYSRDDDGKVAEVLFVTDILDGYEDD